MMIRLSDRICRFVCLLAAVGLIACWGTAGAAEVVVYTAHDQVYSQPVLEAFEKETGIRVRAVYDVEATKTIGLVNRLIAEKDRPRCDVFWNNEIVNTIRLQQKGVLAPYRSAPGLEFPAPYRDPEGYWYGFAARARVIVVNTERLAPEDYPASILELTDPRWRGRATMAYPLFGTTATQAAALFEAWGRERTLQFFEDFKTNGGRFVDGNSVVRDRVADGTYDWGLTDTDDVYSGIQRGLPIAMLLPDQQEDGMGTLVMPNTVALIAGAPHPAEAGRLIDYLLSADTERALAASGSGQIPLRPGLRPAPGVPTLDGTRPMAVDWVRLAERMDEVLPLLEEEL